MIKEVGYYRWPGVGNCGIDMLHELFSEFDEDQVFLVNSGKTAINLILSYYKEIGHLEDKNSEVWVPRWIGSWVYNIMQKNCFPSIVPSRSTKGVVIYHQYGYPQNLDKIIAIAKENDWFVIEDCAHAIMSFYKGQRVGTI
nr:DegT/DnrJ/EryC1/StrS family aminotransferase [Bacteroidota bacterium]